MAHDFQKLTVWKLAFELNKDIYLITKNFPKEEIFGLTSQIRRAAISIPANISEGAGRKTPKDFYHFLSIAQGSCNEVLTMILLAEDIGYIDNETVINLIKKCDEIGKMITGLQKTLN
ncbi:MAG: four helix bundle protein [Candidatus Gracilibacteria bacterium]